MSILRVDKLLFSNSILLKNRLIDQSALGCVLRIEFQCLGQLNDYGVSHPF